MKNFGVRNDEVRKKVHHTGVNDVILMMTKGYLVAIMLLSYLE